MIDYGKRDVLGVLVDAVDLSRATDRVMRSARLRAPCSVTALAVHGIIESNRDLRLKTALNNFDVVLPDGQPVRWALNLLYKLDLPDKVLLWWTSSWPGVPTTATPCTSMAARSQL